MQVRQIRKGVIPNKDGEEHEVVIDVFEVVVECSLLAWA
jgi:hypothetical protein